jgi:hypothetical protein
MIDELGSSSLILHMDFELRPAVCFFKAARALDDEFCSPHFFAYQSFLLYDKN